ncbi:MAG: RNA pseudouridine synthase, partial [Propionibacteriales bacterium]|nr:RNA pseudouridine synthase [Propionibacteriales bacterium]
MTASRVLFVPDGLDGMRVDAAVSRLMGLSRAKVADLVAEGHVVVDGSTVGKSDKVHAGAMLDVTLPADPVGIQVTPQEV